MKNGMTNPYLIGFTVFVLVLSVSLLVPVPLFDATCTYDNKLVHFVLDTKISLRQLIGWDADTLKTQGLLPNKVELKTFGYTLLVLVHVGLPFLAGLRFYYSNQRKALEENE